MNPLSASPRWARLRSPGLVLGLLLLLTGWVVFLRWPTFGAPLWNVDEGIHAAAARTLLDGGVLYRDAVDQRTPLTYYAVALLFRVFGENNLWALRAAVALIIAATALGLFLTGRRAHHSAAGLWGVLIFCALSTNLFYYSDANSANTEWFVVLFTTWGTWWFWRLKPGGDFRASVPVGILFGLAFLSKQPAVFDFAAPLATLAFLVTTGRARAADAARRAGGLLLGSIMVVAATVAYFAARGAFGDMVFYTGTYNLLYYGSDVTASQHLLLAFVPFARLWERYPLVLVVLLAGVILLLLRVAQLRPAPEEKVRQPWAFYLLAWNVTSLAAAVASGRGFEHYFIQCLPAFSLSAGGLLAEAGSLARRLSARDHRSPGTILAAATLALLLAATALSTLRGPLARRGPDEYPHDPAERASQFIRDLTSPAERIFVWGYNSDIYLYTNRKPASRFLYCSFQTGLIPWTNIAPGIDTRYAIVPGTMEQLLADLEAHRPTFFVDCSPGPHRNFSKYPVEKFAPLQAFVTRNYLEAGSAQFVPQGFRLHLIKDRFRLAPVRLAGGPGGRPAEPEIFGPPMAGPVPTGFLVQGEDPDGRLQRLEFTVGGTVVDSVSFEPNRKVAVQFVAPFDRLGPGRYRVVARAIAANGATRDSAAFTVTCTASAVPRDRLADFSLPCVTTALLPLTVRAPFAPSVDQEDGHRVISAHAPSLLSFALPPNARRVHGGFGIRAGAYAASNPAPTDGAEFTVEWISPGGESHVLFHRHLQPRENPDDRPMQFFDVVLPPHPAGGRLDFAIGPGPNGNNASDWTYWSDPQVETSR